MGRFDNYVNNKLAAEQEAMDKKTAEKREQERFQALLKKMREDVYYPMIKKALLEFNDILPRIKKWDTHDEEIIKSVLGIKKRRIIPRQLISLHNSGYWIGKNGKYYKTKRVISTGAIVEEINIEEIADKMMQILKMDALQYNSSYDENVLRKLAKNQEESVYRCLERMIEERV